MTYNVLKRLCVSETHRLKVILDNLVQDNSITKLYGKGNCAIPHKRLAAVPDPDSYMNFFVGLHEIGHVVLSHDQIAPDTEADRICSENIATDYAVEKAKEFGIYFNKVNVRGQQTEIDQTCEVLNKDIEKQIWK